MRSIEFEQVSKTVASLCVAACYELPTDVREALARAAEGQAFLNSLTNQRDKANSYRCAALRLVNMDRQDVLIDWLESIDSPIVRFKLCLGAAQAFDEAYKEVFD